MGLNSGMDKVDESVFLKSAINSDLYLNESLLLETTCSTSCVTVSTSTLTTFTDSITTVGSCPPLITTSSSDDRRLGVDEVILESSRNESQQLSIISNLPNLLQSNNAECLEKVVPHFQEMLSIAEPEIQVAASTAFLQILQKELVPVQTYPQMFLQTILNSIDNKDPDISNAWLGTLLDVIDLLPKDIIKKEILTAAVAKGQLSQSVPARLACCQILGKIATKFDPFVIKKEILPVVQSLCQDVDYKVRGCMCKQLNSVARGLGLEATKSAILPELVELTNDEESYVRMMGLETVVNILSLLDDDTCSNTIIPLVIRFYQQCIYSDNHSLPIIAKHIGSLCHGLSVNLNEKQKEWFLDCYRELCQIGLTDVNIEDSISSEYMVDFAGQFHNNISKFTYLFLEKYFERHYQSIEYFQQVKMHGILTPNKHPILDCRINAAYNFPAMCMFAGYKDFQLKLHDTFSSLCEDPLPAVRRNIARGFHEVSADYFDGQVDRIALFLTWGNVVIKLLGPLSLTLLDKLASLLRDKHIEVLKGISPHLPVIFEVIGKHKCSDVEVGLIIPALTAAESQIFSSHSWRLQEEFMLSLASLPKCFNSERIYTKMMPVIYDRLKKARAVPVRLAVARTFLTLIRTLKKSEHREELLNQLNQDFRKGNCYYRTLYLDICSITLDIYSKSFFKEHFFENCLSLYCDPVPNIRLKLCRFIPRMKQTLKSPEDDVLLYDLTNVISKIRTTDLDPDVLTCAKQLVSKTQEKLQTAEDLIDLHREAEEISLLNDEKTEEKAKAKNQIQYSKIPSPRKVLVPKTTASENTKPTPGLKDSKKTLSTSSSVLPQVSTPKVKTKGSSIPNCRLVKSWSTSSICSVSQIPTRDSKLPDNPCKRDTKIPVMGLSSTVAKDTKISDRLCNNTRIPRVSGAAHANEPVPASMIPTSSGSQKQGKSGIKPTASVSLNRRSTGSAPSPSLSASSSSTSSANTPTSNSNATLAPGSPSTRLTDRPHRCQVNNSQTESNRRSTGSVPSPSSTSSTSSTNAPNSNSSPTLAPGSPSTRITDRPHRCQVNNSQTESNRRSTGSVPSPSSTSSTSSTNAPNSNSSPTLAPGSPSTRITDRPHRCQVNNSQTERRKSFTSK